MTKLHPNYKNQDGCYNCKFCFIFEEYNEGFSYYCNADGSERPLCGSVYMREGFLAHTQNREEWKNLRDKWITWAKNREVKPCGICDLHKKR